MSIDAQIENAIARYRSYVLACSYLKKLEEEVTNAEWNMAELERNMSHSKAQLLRSKKTGGMDLLLQPFVKSDEEEILELEKDRYYELILQYNNAKKFIEGAQFDINVLKEKVAAGAHLQQEMHDLMQQRKDELTERKLGDIAPVFAISERLDDRIGLRTEIEEAIAGGEQLLAAIEEAHTYMLELKEDMKKAGRFDSLIGIRLVKLDHLQQLAVTCKMKLLAYEDEILDIYAYINIPHAPKLREGNEFIDEYFAALTTDHLLGLGWKTSASYLDVISQKVLRIQIALKTDLEQIKKQISELSQQRDEVIKQLEI